MTLSTAAKLRLARIARQMIGLLLKVRGVDPASIVCARRGVRWSLDIDAGIQFAIFLGVYEPSTYRALMSLVKSDSIVLDVGANVGAHALPLSHRLRNGGRVIAVEPTDSAIARLRRNRELNPEVSDSLVLAHCALGDGRPSEDWYYSRWPLLASDSAHPVHLGEAQPSSANGLTLDRLVDELGLPRVDLIKLDVDGNELPIISGALETLCRHRPRLVVEVCPYLLAERGADVAALLRPLLDNGYSLYAEDTFKPLGEMSRWVGAIPEGGSVNVIASTTPLPPMQ